MFSQSDTNYIIQLNKLHLIKKDILEEKNPYKLSDSEKQDFNIVLNTLEYIIRNIKGLSAREGNARTVFFIDKDTTKYAPVHLENYKSGEEGEQQLMGSLVDPFILSYEAVKKSAYHVKQFISKLNGICIDARTRTAFDYALTLGKDPTFTDYLNEAYDLIKQKSNLMLTYWTIFEIIYNTCWDKPYTKDSTSSGYAKSDGVFDELTFPMISQFILDLGYKPDESIYFKNKNLSTDFFKFTFWHGEFFEKMAPAEFLILDKDNKLIENKKYQSDETTLINLGYANLAWHIPYDYVKTKRDFDNVVNLLNRAPCEIFFSCSSKLILPEENKKEHTIILLEHYIRRLKYTKHNDTNLYNEIKNESSFIVQAAIFDHLKTIQQYAELSDDFYPRSNRLLLTAVQYSSWEVVNHLIEKSTFFEKDILQQCIYYICKNKQFDVCRKLLIKNNARLNYYYINEECALDYTIKYDEISLSENLLRLCGTPTNKPLLIRALESNDTTQEKLVWLLKQEKKFNVVSYNDSKALVTAMKKSSYAVFEYLVKNNIFNLSSLILNISDKSVPDYAQKINLLDQVDINIRLIKELLFQSMREGEERMNVFYQKDPAHFDFKKLTEDIKNNEHLINITYRFLKTNLALIILRKDESLYQSLKNLLPSQSQHEIEISLPEIKLFMQEINKNTQCSPLSSFFPPLADKKRKAEGELEEAPVRKKQKI